jgi:hypothetical protein
MGLVDDQVLPRKLAQRPLLKVANLVRGQQHVPIALSPGAQTLRNQIRAFVLAGS